MVRHTSNTGSVIRGANEAIPPLVLAFCSSFLCPIDSTLAESYDAPTQKSFLKTRTSAASMCSMGGSASERTASTTHWRFLADPNRLPKGAQAQGIAARIGLHFTEKTYSEAVTYNHLRKMQSRGYAERTTDGRWQLSELARQRIAGRAEAPRMSSPQGAGRKAKGEEASTARRTGKPDSRCPTTSRIRSSSSSGSATKSCGFGKRTCDPSFRWPNCSPKSRTRTGIRDFDRTCGRSGRPKNERPSRARAGRHLARLRSPGRSRAVPAAPRVCCRRPSSITSRALLMSVRLQANRKGIRSRWRSRRG